MIDSGILFNYYGGILFRYYLHDLQVAQEISELERPNLVVYGGGDEIQDFCRRHGLLYIHDFINAKKK